MSSIRPTPLDSGRRMSDFGDLYHATMGCISRFEACLSAKPLMRKGWAESRLADMNLWASGVGALARPEVSLDRRLQFHSGPRLVLYDFLLTFQVFIDSCRLCALDKTDGGKLDEAEPEDTPTSSPESTFESTPGDGSDLGWLTDLGFVPTVMDTDGQSLGTTLEKAMQDVDDLMDQLIMFGFAIRRSGTTARLRKADASFKHDENKDLEKYLEFIVLKNFANRQIDGEGITARMEEIIAKEEMSNVTPEQRHLILANLRRRHRFRYARRHQQKLNPIIVNTPAAKPKPVTRVHQDDQETENQKSSPTDDSPSTALPTIVPGIPFIPNLSETAPSAAEGDILKVTIPSQSAASRVSVSVARMHYPPPPPTDGATRSFKCPCCYQTLPEMFRERSRWRKHLVEDLCPYTCPFPECPRPEVLYNSRTAWHDHVLGAHGAGRYWECLLCAGTGTPNTFRSVEEFTTHNRTKHQDTISEDQIIDLQDSCRQIAPPNIAECPLCAWPRDEELVPDASATLEHIGNCIHEFSLNAFPWAISSLEGYSSNMPQSFIREIEMWLQETATTKEEPDIQKIQEVIKTFRFIPVPLESKELELAHVANEYFAESSEGSSQIELGSLSFDDDLPEVRGTYSDDVELDPLVTQRRHFMVPFPRNDSFVGRDAILKQLLETVPPSASNHDCHRITIRGHGGIGKTQIALETAYQVRDRHPDCSVFWVPGENLTSFENAYRKIGKLLKIPGIGSNRVDVRALVKAGLEHTNAGEWILIIQNADQPAKLADYLPSSRQGSILFTTRNGSDSPGIIIPVRAMNDAEASDLLRKGLRESQVGNAESRSRLLEHLAYSPLEIKQASAFMAQNTNVTISEYLELFESSYADLQPSGYERISVLTTWIISFKRLLEHSPQAANCLEFICLLAETDIPLSLLQVTTEIEIREVIRLLNQYAFILQRNPTDSFDIHPLIRHIMQIWLQKEKKIKELIKKVVQQLADKFPLPTYKNERKWIRYLPHGIAVLEMNPAIDIEKGINLMLKIAESYFLFGELNKAKRLYYETVRIRKLLGGQEVRYCT
ncbi:hypothetical protein F4802DRAFT_582036 [Xylaria palmicola]|nr:hypothetical protein F4802DRAFT_582036 [Xylaria palmicola]